MRRRLPWAAVALIALAASVNVASVGCGSESDPITDETPDAANEAAVPVPEQDAGAVDAFIDAILDGARADAANCKLVAQTCAKSGDCCSLNCNTTTLLCDAPTNNCSAPDTTCSTSTECCTLSCIGAKCASKLCVADNLACGSNDECCGGTCAPDGTGGGKCKPLNGTGPATSGNPCATNADCSSMYCQNGTCTTPSFCAQTDDVCASNYECCGGVCTKAAGATIGKCGAPAPAPGGTGCLAGGSVCGTGAVAGTLPACGGECCSRSCGPSSATGILVCQPSSGCHPTGEICRADSDCCGWSGSPEPKKGFVTCSKSSPTQEFGRCDNGGSCREPGSICKPSDYTCNAENNCCDPTGEASNYCNSNPDNCCRRDSLGVPRCLIKPLDCVGAPPVAGATCATSADCCGKPCVDNKCIDMCVPKSGACTATADCCAGMPCAIPPGATKGACGGVVLGDGGVGTTDAGGADGSTNEGGTGEDGGACALYGQLCTQSSACCSSVPCTNGTCHYP